MKIVTVNNVMKIAIVMKRIMGNVGNGSLLKKISVKKKNQVLLYLHVKFVYP